nr:hypothetical protein TQ38_24710 [Novosphingobium sp. P6W]
MSDARPLIWQDSVESIARFWPLGSGIGTFDEVFQIDETLENIGPGRAARAHNEYIEVAIESGLLGLTLLASWLIFLFMSGLKAARRGGTAIAPIPIFIMLALQSILDYPLRNETLLCVSGLMLALLVDSPYRRRSSVSGSDRQCDLGTGSA